MRSASKQEWFDDDQYWRELYAFMFSEKRFADASEQVPKLLTLAKPAAKAVLDLGCGPGRFCIPLAKLGFHVTGLDNSRYLLRKARARAKSARAHVEWVRQDMRDFVRPDRFDLVLSMFTSFGYFEDDREDAQVLSNVFRSLRPGGSFLIDLMGKEVLARIAQPAVCEVLPNGAKLVQRAEICAGWRRIRHEWTLVRGETARTFQFQTTIYSGRELADLLSTVGYADVRLYGGLEGEEYDLNARRLIAVARKPATCGASRMRFTGVSL